MDGERVAGWDEGSMNRLALIRRGAMLGYRALVLVAAAATIVIALVPPRGARGDEADVWMVSTRRLPGTCAVPVAPEFAVERFVADPCVGRGLRGRWVGADLASLLEDGKPVVIFIHGNRYASSEAKQQGLLLAQRCGAAAGMGTVRTVIYSWPSMQQGILLKDVRAKYDRTFTEGRYLAWLLGQIEPTRDVSIIGYSFGAQITLEALEHVVVAEEAGRHDLQPWRERPGQTNLVFIVPAVRCDALAPRGPYRHAIECVDNVSIIINSRDDALKFFPLIDRDTRLAALGRIGMPRQWIPEHVGFAAVDAHRTVGKQHGLPQYLESPTLTKRLCSAAMCGLE